MAAQFTFTNGPFHRSLCTRMAHAIFAFDEHGGEDGPQRWA